MANTQNTTATVVTTQAELSGGMPTSINYSELLQAARAGDEEAQGDLMTRLQRQHEDVRTWLNDKDNKNRPATMYTSEMFAILENRLHGIRRGNFKISDPQTWAMFEDHQVTKKPYMGRFSTYDLAQLTRGHYQYINSKKTWIQGIQSLGHLANYGDLSASPTGWQLSLNGTEYQLSAEQAFELMKHYRDGNAKKLVQAMPYDRLVCMNGHRMEKQTPNGISVVLLAGVTYTDKDNTLYTLREDTRVSLTHTDHKMLMYPVASFRYHQDDDKGTCSHLASIVKECLGEYRIPANRDEVDYCQVVSWFIPMPDEKKLEYLRPGRFLSGHHLEITDDTGKVVEPSDFQSLETYIAAKKRIKLQNAAEALRRQEAKANGQQQAPKSDPVEEVDPFLLDFIDDIA